MKNTDDFEKYTENANKLLDAVMARLDLKSDAALSRCLAVTPPVISKIRHGRTEIGAAMLISLHEASDLSIAELKIFLKSDGVSRMCDS
ncbi:hypothetical protein BCF11_2448 [Collimonas sp. PA-H2]|uniref:hypothetical protein n=1 Tax=Collimonas sp. PA-H2 TaxID=1881062 RepID=UPI000BF7B4D0|nr:hypothetical protein [Collimonas sp. PA-H2]PFH10043.1 hypothetical protein BCF11_2448 [Collimonas sp. PA-H2]